MFIAVAVYTLVDTWTYVGYLIELLVMFVTGLLNVWRWRLGMSSIWTYMTMSEMIKNHYSGLILGLHPANERRRYKVTPSLIGWAQT